MRLNPSHLRERHSESERGREAETQRESKREREREKKREREGGKEREREDLIEGALKVGSEKRRSTSTTPDTLHPTP